MLLDGRGRREDEERENERGKLEKTKKL